jgi:hypothetical protein
VNEKIVAKIKALRALATSSNVNEAAAAAAAATRLLLKNDLKEADISSSEPEEAPFRGSGRSGLMTTRAIQSALQETINNLRERGRELDAAITSLLLTKDEIDDEETSSDAAQAEHEAAWKELRRVACKCPKHYREGR